MGVYRFTGEGALKARAMAGLRAGVIQGAGRVSLAAKAATPRDTGRLADGINVTGVKAGASTVAATISTTGTAEYATYRHEGTSSITADPFMTQGLAAASPQAVAAIKAAVARAF